MASDADRLLQAIPIETYIQRYLRLKRKGANLWANCPFHGEKTASFSVSPEKGIFKCFGCGKGGNLITFVQEYERVDFPEALKILSEYSGIPLEGRRNQSAYKEKAEKQDQMVKALEKAARYFRQHISRPEPLGYLKKRGINDESIKYFRLGYSPPEFRHLESNIPTEGEDKSNLLNQLLQLGVLGKGQDNQTYNRFKGRVIFPIFNTKNQVVAFGGRIIENLENTGKYINSPESPLFHKKEQLYNLNFAIESIRKNQQVIVVEGYLDVIGLHQAGIKNAVAPLGTAMTREHAKILKRYADRVILFFDNDKAGIEAAFRALFHCRGEKLETRIVIRTTGDTRDPFDLALEENPVDLLAILDMAKTESAFILWYFFTFKYNLKNSSQKREALESFFRMLQEFEYDWEVNDYLENCSLVTGINKEALENDYRKFIKGEPVTRREQIKEPEKQRKIDPVEKEILALLLYFSSYWSNEALLAELEWSSKEITLLYGFFRDRLKAGQFWRWEELGQVISILPQELTPLITDILMNFDPVFNPPNEEKSEYSQKKKEILFSEKLNKLVMIHKKQRLNREIERLQKELLSAEATQSDQLEEISNQLTEYLARRNQIELKMAGIAERG